MPQMMKALVKREATKGIWMDQVPVPEIGPNDVLIKLEKTAICGTDLHIYLWDCLLYTSPSPRDLSTSRMPSSA